MKNHVHYLVPGNGKKPTRRALFAMRFGWVGELALMFITATNKSVGVQ